MYLPDEKHYKLIELPKELYQHISGIYTPDDCRFFAATEKDGVIPEHAFSAEELSAAYRRGVVNKKKTEAGIVYCAADFYSRMECVIEAELNLFRSLESEDYLLIQKHMMSPAIWLEPRLKAEPNDSVGVEGIMPLEVARKHYQEAKGVFYIARCNCNAYMDRCIGRDKSRVCIHCFEGELPINTIYDRGLVAQVSKEEAIKQLEYADSVGLVHSVHVRPKGVGTCNCCTCCCFQFSHYKEYDIKGSFLKTDYLIEVNGELCVNCQSCAERCPFEALQSNGEKMTVDAEKCWGCGLCRNACPTDALVIGKREIAKRTDMITLPEHFEEFAEARREGFIRIKELKESGQKICGTFCQYAPAEIIDAAGLYQVGLCGRSSASIPAAEEHLPANLCPLIKSSYGHALEDSCPYAYFSDLVVGETTCDGKKKMYELLGKIKPMHVIHLPNVPDYERSLEAWTDELKHFIEVLEAHFGENITEEKLREAIRWGNLERIQAARIYELGKYDPPAITGLDMCNIMDGEKYLFDKEEKYSKLKQILDLCEKDWFEGNGPYKPDEHPLRIMVSGAGTAGVIDKTIAVIEQLGAAIVCYEGCGGISSRRRLVDEDPSRDPIESIAEKYLEVPCAVMSPNSRRMEQIAATIAEWKVDGAINITLHSCLPFGIEARNVGKVCESCGVPHLHLETDFYPGDEQQLRTRIEAFLEMVQQRKNQL